MTRVKICGLTREADLDAAIAAGADLVGLVHFPKSPRHLGLPAAAALARRAKATGRAEVVVLLVDPTDELVKAAADTIGPDILQLHGHESAERVGEIRRLADVRILKAVPVGSSADVEAALAFLAPGERADLLLFDAKPPATPGSLPGGNGLAFDWHMLDGLKGRVRFGLAGGLTPDNARAAAELTGADLLDVSSGVESRPGEKDALLIRRFLQEAKAAKQTS